MSSPVVYFNSKRNIAIVVSNRTGSSLMSKLSEDDSSGFKILPGTKKEIVETLTSLQDREIDLFITVKDPTARRKSALDMLAGQYPDLVHNLYSLKGMIHTANQYEKHTILPNYILADSHLDWSNSVLYHCLTVKGININPLLLTSEDPTWQDHPLRPKAVQYSAYIDDKNIPTYTSFLAHYLTGTPAIQILEYNRAQQRHNLENLSLRSLLYETWLLEFRKKAIIFDENLILTIDEFEGFDQRCHQSLMRKHNDCEHYESSEDLVDWMLNKFVGHSNVHELCDRGYNVPCVYFLEMFDKYNEVML